MSEPEGVLQVVIWVPDGVSHQHWVHRCQFLQGDFVLRQTPAAEAEVTPGGPGQGPKSRGAVE